MYTAFKVDSSNPALGCRFYSYLWIVVKVETETNRFVMANSIGNQYLQSKCATYIINTMQLAIIVPPQVTYT